MKKICILATLMMATGLIHAQESWQVILHKKVVLTGKEISEEKNIKPVTSADWKKNGWLEVNFKEEPKTTWRHSIQFTDENGTQLLIRDSVTFTKVATSSLRKLFAGKKQVKIYMIISPPNPMMLAPTRMKHLVTLKLP
ncbi:MAG: hypothetical protein ACT4OJ_07575 [Bacteroidota bacterium]